MPQRPLEARDAVGARAKQPGAQLRARLHVRAATEADVPAIVAIINAAYRERDWELFRALRTSEESYPSEMARRDFEGVVAELDGRIVGHLGLDLSGDRAELGLLATAVDAQGAGIGTVLIEHAEARAHEAGHAQMRLDCVRDTGLPPYYASLGYTIEREEYGQPWNALRAFTLVYMKKDLL